MVSEQMKAEETERLRGGFGSVHMYADICIILHRHVSSVAFQMIRKISASCSVCVHVDLKLKDK